MNRELQSYCRRQFEDFKEHLIKSWGITFQPGTTLESTLKSLYKQHLGVTTLCTILAEKDSRGVYLSAVPEASELAIILTAKGLCNSAYVLMRQCIELTLKHIYFSTHPVEFQWSQTREGYREIGFQFLLEYLRKTEEFSQSGTETNLITEIEGDFHKFSRYVHVHSSKFMAFLDPDCSPIEIADNTLEFASSARSLSSRLCFLLVLFFREQVLTAQANELALIKNAVVEPLGASLKKLLARVA